MTDVTPAAPTAEEIDQLLLSMRRKMGTWVEWAEASLILQKAGYTDQQIFEAIEEAARRMKP